MTVIATGSSLGLAAKLARTLSQDLIIIEEKSFPDGEKYVRVPQKIKGKAILVHSTHPPQDERFIQLLLAIDAVKNSGASKVVVVVPYLAYARQDKRFMEGEPISIGVILRSLQVAGADAFITVDVHNPSSLDEWLNIPHLNVLPIVQLAEYFKGTLHQPLVLAPDKGAIHRARAIAELLKASYDYLEKRRDRTTGELSLLPKNIEVEGKDVLIVDDIISTGSTLMLAAKSVLMNGAKRVHAACTHAILASSALDKLYNAGVSDIVATDTIPSPTSKISVAEPLANAVSSLL
ncbi:MAG: ribose-phosphate diphosphokinase [Thermofilaceae archaeon]